MPRIMRRMEFDAGHRVLGHESKCANLHGHRYVVEVRVLSLGLDSLGRVVDFGVVKQMIGNWLDDTLDHTMLLHPDDPLLKLSVDAQREILGPRMPFVMPQHIPNPTAENIAHVIYDVAEEKLNGRGLSVHSVRVWETPNCYAEFP